MLLTREIVVHRMRRLLKLNYSVTMISVEQAERVLEAMDGSGHVDGIPAGPRRRLYKYIYSGALPPEAVVHVGRFVRIRLDVFAGWLLGET